jgi:hypothetical protein
MTRNGIIGLLVTLAIGAALVVYGVRQLSSDDVSCGGARMSKGDVCVTTGSGSSGRRGVDEQRSQDRQGDYIAIGIGGLLIVGAVFFTVMGARQRRTAVR